MPITFLNVQGNGGTAVPFERRNAQQALSAIALNPQDALRMKRYEEHWRFYSGIQWSFAREDGQPLVTANYCRPIVNKKASWLVGKGMVVDVPEALQQTTKPILEEVWDYNQRDRLLLEMAITGGVTGDVFALTTYQQPTSQQLNINPYTQGKIRIRLLGSHQVFPTWNPLNHEEITHLRIITEVADQNPLPEQQAQTTRTPITMGSLGVQRKRRWIEDIYPDTIFEGWEDAPRPSRSNDLGEIPLAHAVNEPFPGEFYGMSDLDGIIDIQREYNEKLTDVSDIVNYHAAPITIMTGARAKHLERGPKNLWSGFPADAKVYTLAQEGDLAMSHKYLETVLRVMFDIANFPEGSLGRMQPISNTSGVALQVQFQPLIEVTERKTPSYRALLEKINYFILRYWQLATGQALPVDLCKHCGGRVVELQETGQDGSKKIRRKCFMIDPQTLDFLNPDEVEVNIKRKFSYGVETRLLPFAQVKKEFLKESASAWDPAEAKDLQEEMDKDAERGKKVQAFRKGEQEDNDAQDEEKRAAAPPTPAAGAKPGTKPSAAGAAGAGKASPPAHPPEPRAPEPLPPELEKPPEAKPDQLAPHDMDIPDEPEEHEVTVMEWDPSKREFVAVSLGKRTIVPTGCKRPRHLSPYTNKVTLRSALPRDRERDANLFAQYQENLWVSRRWCQEHIDEEINSIEVDKQIADDIPLFLAREAKPEAGVAQTAGAQPGDNNGAPLPPGPGPGRGNKAAPGDNLAQKAPTGAAQGGQ